MRYLSLITSKKFCSLFTPSISLKVSLKLLFFIFHSCKFPHSLRIVKDAYSYEVFSLQKPHATSEAHEATCICLSFDSLCISGQRTTPEGNRAPPTYACVSSQTQETGYCHCRRVRPILVSHKNDFLLHHNFTGCIFRHFLILQ